MMLPNKFYFMKLAELLPYYYGKYTKKIMLKVAIQIYTVWI